MLFNKMIEAVDTHTSGAPTRIIYNPVTPCLANMAQTLAYWKNNHDWIRKSLMFEPRGYSEMTGTAITQSISKEACCGLIFFDGHGYMDMCGHAVVGVATAISELNIVIHEGNEFAFDTVAGLVKTEVKTNGYKVEEAIIENVPSYKIGEVSFELEEEKIDAKIAYAGNIFAILESNQFSYPLEADYAEKWSKLGILIRKKLNSIESVLKMTDGKGVSMVEFSGPPKQKTADYKNIVMFGNGQIDREPCATGTCAKMACMYAEGKTNIGDVIVQESILDTYARATLLESVDTPKGEAIIVRVSYSVFITGIHKYFFNDKDPLRYGYTLGR